MSETSLPSNPESPKGALQHPVTHEPPWEPYRVLFPLGATLGLLGAGVWPLAVWPGIPYPGPQHALLMIQGFELAFVSGFLLTVAPRMTKTNMEDHRELPWLVLGLVGFGIAASLGHLLAAHVLTLATLLLLAFAVTRRFARRQNDPPEEAIFVPWALLFGLTGALLQVGATAGWFSEPVPRLGLRLLSVGMVLTLVLGFGALLVPVFLEVKKPLFIPGIAEPHERPARRRFYLVLGALLLLSFLADAIGVRAAGPWARALVGTVVLALSWKIWRLPGRRTIPAFAMWASGWCIGAGLWLSALLPLHSIAAMHLTLLGGFGALTMGIASRVVVTHGGRAPTEEARLLTLGRAAWLGLSLASRLVAEFDAPRTAFWLALSGLAWIAAWAGWLLAARPHLRRGRKPAPALGLRVVLPQPGGEPPAAPVSETR